MLRLRALVVSAGALLALVSCGRTTGDILIVVDWARHAEGPGCVILTATDVVARTHGMNVNKAAPVDLLGKGVGGTLRFAVAQPLNWSERVAFEATLRAESCMGPVLGPVLATDTWEISFEPNQHKDHTLVVHEGPLTDGGADDAGVDGGADGGVDAGDPDAGDPDAGAGDGGSPNDAGSPDSGAGDAGPRCVGALRTLVSGSENWADLAVFDRDTKSIIAVGAADAVAIIDASGVKTRWSGGTCHGTFVGVWVDPISGLAHVLSNDQVLIARGAGTCEVIASFSGLNPTALAGVHLADGGTRLIVASSDSPFLSEVRSDGGLGSFSVPGAGMVFDVAALDEQTMVAVGQSSNGAKSMFWKLIPPSTWEASGEGASNAPVRGVDLLSPTFGFAGGTASTYSWNGSVWSATLDSPGFTVRGVAARAPTDVLVVGEQRGGGMVGFATYDGSTWTPAALAAPALKRVRTLKCDAWAVGNGVVVTTLP